MEIIKYLFWYEQNFNLETYKIAIISLLQFMAHNGAKLNILNNVINYF